MRILCLFLSLFAMSHLSAQSDPELPYREIPEAPEDYTSGNMAARMIDGLGFRYYWATEGLRQEDLDYKPSEDARSCWETLQHLHGLSGTIINAAKNQPNARVDNSEMTFEEIRKATLENLAEAATLMRGKNAEEVGELKVIFQRGERQSSFPYWNMINGPIADAIWHAGQIVSFRRASGNPFNGRASVFMGTAPK
ncbi:MAG: hypothetical protein AAFR61_24410 [Bacteroidota bacterium]